MKILIIRFSSIGDIVLTTPVIRCLKKQLPNAEIHYLTKASFTSLLTDNPYIHKIWGLESDLKSLVKELKKEQFDHIVDLHNNLRSKRVSLSLGVSTTRVNKLNWQKWLLVKTGRNYLPNVHIVDRYLDVVKEFEVYNDSAGLDYFIPSSVERPANLPVQYICYAIGGQHTTKKMPTQKMIDLCNSIQSNVVLIGGKEDETVGSTIENACSNVMSLCGQISIHQSAMVMDASDAVISHDTGMMHIASALKKRIISIWGNTVPSFGMYPYLPGEGSKQFEVTDLPCRPCSKIGFDKCPKGHFNCMQQQNVEAIAASSAN